MTIRWPIIYWTLQIGFIVAAVLNLLHVRAGFLTSHLADLTVPAWLYLVSRGFVPGKPTQFALTRWIGRTPERAASVLLLASVATEISQRYWPHGLFSGHFDPFDIAAFGLGIAFCYLCDRFAKTQDTANAAA